MLSPSCSQGHVFVGLVALSIVTSLMGFSQEWRGFHGAEKQGVATLGQPPIAWNSTEGVLWKTSIPGKGHSSPVVHGDAVFLTTAYPDAGFARFRVIVYTACVFLAVLAPALATFVAWRDWRDRSAATSHGTLRKVRDIGSIILHLALCLVVIVRQQDARFGPNDSLAWKLGVMTLLISLGAIVVSGAKSRIGCFCLAAVAIGATLLIALLYPEYDDLIRERSWPGLTTVVLFAAPCTAALALLFVGFISRAQSASPDGRLSPAYAVPGVLSILAACMFFLDATHLRRVKNLVYAIVCVDASTGQRRWVCEGLRGSERALTSMNTPASSTCATDGDRIIAWFDPVGVVGVNNRGQVLWSNQQLVSRPKYGIVSSVVLADGIAVLVSDVEESNAISASSWIAALDATSGKVLWRKTRQGHRDFAGYATPVIASLEGRKSIWIRGWQDVIGYDLATGNLLATFPSALKAHHLVASPVLDSTRLLLCGASGHLSISLTNIIAGQNPVLWTTKSRGEICATPVVVDGLAYLIHENGWATCLDMETGRVVWETRLRGRYFSSVIAAGRQVYFVNERGMTSVVAQGRQFKLLAENDLRANTYASAAPIGDRLLFRTVQDLYTIQTR